MGLQETFIFCLIVCFGQYFLHIVLQLLSRTEVFHQNILQYFPSHNACHLIHCMNFSSLNLKLQQLHEITFKTSLHVNLYSLYVVNREKNIRAPYHFFCMLVETAESDVEEEVLHFLETVHKKNWES